MIRILLGFLFLILLLIVVDTLFYILFGVNETIIISSFNKKTNNLNELKFKRNKILKQIQLPINVYSLDRIIKELDEIEKKIKEEDELK